MQTNNQGLITKYVNAIIRQVQLTSKFEQYETIYLGGGTPNFIPDRLLDKLLNTLKKYLVTSNYEFTIECNPDLLTPIQAQIFINNLVNRVSLGVQSTNNKILSQMHRTHKIEDVKNAINLLRDFGIDNISCDFIYNLPNETINDLNSMIDFLVQNNIKHVSIYALEIKTNAILNKEKYHIDVDLEEEKLVHICKIMENNGYERYEISNWCKNNEKSLHNLAYWQSKQWKAIGYGAHGFEHHNLYQIGGKITDFQVDKIDFLNEADYYFQILMMGLRLKSGINLSIKDNYNAYEYYKDKLENVIIENNFLRCKNIDVLNDTLIKLLMS